MTSQIRAAIKHISNSIKINPLKKSRLKNYVLLRQSMFAYLREKGYSYPEIGEIFNMNHTTVFHSLSNKGSVRENAYNEIVAKVFDQFLDKETPKFLTVEYRPKWLTVFKQRGYACEVCGFDDIVEVHHIDKSLGGRIDNLRVVCPNCHAKIHAGMMFFKS